MHKKIIYISLLLILSGCGAPGAALLSSVFTGVTTKSAARAGLSYSSNQYVKTFKKTQEDKKNKNIVIRHNQIFFANRYYKSLIF